MILPQLSKAEYKVAELISWGFSEKEVAVKLFVSPNTVHNHTYSIRKKWDARSAVDVARKFILNLDNPKQFFTVLTFLTIQFHIMGALPDIDLRKSNTIVRVKTSKRNNEGYQYT